MLLQGVTIFWLSVCKKEYGGMGILKFELKDVSVASLGNWF